MSDVIRGKVAKVLSERELIINKGDDDGVKIGMRFKVLYPEGENILDPDTNAFLGNVEIEKVIVKVIETQAKLALARTFRTIRVPATGIYETFSGTFAAMGKPASEHIESLKYEDNPGKASLKSRDSFIKVGDPVVQTLSNSD